MSLDLDLDQIRGMRSVGHPGRVATRTVQRLGRRVVNLSLAGQFGARRAPVGLATGPGAALAGLPLVVRPRLVARTLVGPVRSPMEQNHQLALRGSASH